MMRKISQAAQEMIEVYRSWPEYAEESYTSSEKIDVKFDNIVFSGMGGSGIIGDILSHITKSGNVSVSKGYFLPKNMTRNTLVICNSASGNTIETLSLLKEAHKNKCKIVGFASGGKIEAYCKKNNIEFKKYKVVSSPRSSLVLSLYTILGALSESLGIHRNDINESMKNLKQTKREIFSNSKDNPSSTLSKFISGIPICYYSPVLLPAALRFKNDFQENCKKHAMIEEIAESCHNSINAWERSSIVRPILLRKADEPNSIKKQFEVVKEYYKSKKLVYEEIFTPKGNLLNSLINPIYYMGYATILRSISEGIDPTDIPAIRFIKARL